MDFRRLVLLHMAFTLAMVGLMSAVQLVIYPQFRDVAEVGFSEYVTSHGQNIMRPLVLFAPAEVLLALVIWLKAPPGTTKNVAFISGLLLAIAWVLTALWYGPLHGRLANQPYDPARIDQLINTNWARTILWWCRGVIAVWLVSHVGITSSSSNG